MTPLNKTIIHFSLVSKQSRTTTTNKKIKKTKQTNKKLVCIYLENKAGRLFIIFSLVSKQNNNKKTHTKKQKTTTKQTKIGFYIIIWGTKQGDYSFLTCFQNKTTTKSKQTKNKTKKLVSIYLGNKAGRSGGGGGGGGGGVTFRIDWALKNPTICRIYFLCFASKYSKLTQTNNPKRASNGFCADARAVVLTVIETSSGRHTLLRPARPTRKRGAVA